jgi:hypothetical protein
MTGKAPVPNGLAVPTGPSPARASADSSIMGEGWLVDPELVDPAYAETMASSGLQTSLPPPKPVPQTPEWLRNFFEALGDFFVWSGPVLKYVLWAAALLILLVIAYHLFPGFAQWVNGLRRRAPEEADVEYGAVEASAARARLADADALAREGRYAEAVHLLLYRSVDDIAARRPGLVAPAITSRDLAASRDLPGVARGAFSQIARAVEVSLFGGRPVDSQAWEECRAAYAELTVARNWAAA